MSGSESQREPRGRVLCVLRDGPTPEALRWSQALRSTGEVEWLDLSAPGLDYGEALKRIFAVERVVSW